MGEQDGFSNRSDFGFMIGKRRGEMELPLRVVFWFMFGWRDARCGLPMVVV